MKPLVSVVVPIYMVEKYLNRCVESLVNQTYKNLEIILVDDGSLDSCPKICDEWEDKDQRIQVIHKENGGLSDARNAGIARAKGVYIALVDSDDFVALDFIETLLNTAIETQSDIVQCRYEYVAGDRMTKDKEKVENTEIFTGREMIAGFAWKDGAYNVVAWNKLYKRELFEDISYPKGRIHEDEATSYRLFYQADKVAFVYRYLYGYYTGGSSITRDSFSKKRLDWEWAVYERIKFLEQHKESKLAAIHYKLYMDGCIDLYFKTLEQLKDIEAAKHMKEHMKKIYGKVIREKSIPARTKMGYTLFLSMPKVFKKIVSAGQ